MEGGCEGGKKGGREGGRAKSNSIGRRDTGRGEREKNQGKLLFMRGGRGACRLCVRGRGREEGVKGEEAK